MISCKLIVHRARFAGCKKPERNLCFVALRSISMFFCRAKEPKALKPAKEISASLHYAEPRSSLALHAPFPPHFSTLPFAETQLRATRRYSCTGFAFLFCEKNRFRLSL